MKNLDVKQHLIDAKAMIEDPSNWTTGNFKDPNGSCCALGAMAEARKISYLVIGCYYAVRLLDDVAASILKSPPEYSTCPETGNYVVKLNDRHGHTAVMTMFDTAIQNAPDRSSCSFYVMDRAYGRARTVLPLITPEPVDLDTAIGLATKGKDYIVTVFDESRQRYWSLQTGEYFFS